MKKNRIKYIVIGILTLIPLFMILITLCTPIKKIENTYTLEETNTINEYYYNTNDVNNVDDLIVDNYYLLNTNNQLANFVLAFEDYTILNIEVSTQYTNNGDLSTPTLFLSGNQYAIRLYKYNEKIIGYYCTNLIMIFKYKSGSNRDLLLPYVTALPNEYNIIVKTTTNNTYNEQALTKVEETKDYNYKAINQFISTIKQFPLYEQYEIMLDWFNVEIEENNIFSIITLYPLYMFYEIILIILYKVICFIPLLFIKLAKKWGGNIE